MIFINVKCQTNPPPHFKYQKKWFFYNEVLPKDIVSLTLTLGWKNKKQPIGSTELDLEAGNLVSDRFLINLPFL